MPDEEGIKETLLTKIGPLPAIAWGGIVGGTYVIYRYYKASKSPAPSPTVSDMGDLGTAGDFSQGFGNTTPGLGGSGGSIVNGPVSDTTPTNNSMWGKLAVDWLIANGVDPADAEYAIATYLFGTGNVLNDIQSSALRMALKHFGSPPEGVIEPPPTTPPPNPSPTTPPPSTAPPPSTNPGPTTPSVSPEASAAFAAARLSFVAAQNLANYTGGPIEGPHGIMIAPHQLANAVSWTPFDEALHDQNRAQQVANYIRAQVWGPNGLVSPQ